MNYSGTVLVDGYDFFNKQIDIEEYNDHFVFTIVERDGFEKALLMASGKDHFLNFLQTASQPLTLEVNGKILQSKYVSLNCHWEMHNSADINNAFDDGLSVDEIGKTVKCYSHFVMKVTFSK